MAADHQITTTVQGHSFSATPTEQKIFLSREGYGFTLTGAFTYQGRPASHWMEKLLHRFSGRGLSVLEYTLKLCAAFYQLAPTSNAIVIGAGFEGKKPRVWSCNSAFGLKNRLENSHTCICVSGENELALKIIDAVPIARDDLTLTDMVEFEKHVVRTVSNIQRFAQTPVTVSPDCDVLLITGHESKWVIPPYNDRL